MKRIERLVLVLTMVVTGQAFIHAEQVAFQLEDRPIVQLVESKAGQTERYLEWGFPMSINYQDHRPKKVENRWEVEFDFEWSKSHMQPQLRESAWNGFIIASSEPITFGGLAYNR